MAFLDPRQAKAAYENYMKDTLYAAIEKDEQHSKSLKSYVDAMYRREWYYELLVNIEILVVTSLIFFWVCVPAVSQILNGGAI